MGRKDQSRKMILVNTSSHTLGISCSHFTDEEMEALPGEPSSWGGAEPATHGPGSAWAHLWFSFLPLFKLLLSAVIYFSRYKSSICSLQTIWKM